MRDKMKNTKACVVNIYYYMPLSSLNLCRLLCKKVKEVSVYCVKKKREIYIRVCKLLLFKIIKTHMIQYIFYRV